MSKYEIRDIELAPSGHKKIQWVKHNMPLLAGLEKKFAEERPFEGILFIWKQRPLIFASSLLQEEQRCM